MGFRFLADYLYCVEFYATYSSSSSTTATSSPITLFLEAEVAMCDYDGGGGCSVRGAEKHKLYVFRFSQKSYIYFEYNGILSK